MNFSTNNKETLKSQLEDAFKSEEAMGVTYEDEYGDGNEIATLPDGNEMGRCTNCAHFVVATVGRGQVFGFLVDHNPVTHDEIDACGGHDFAVIDGRFIVDPWISHYTGCEEQTVFDMQSNDDLEMITSIYGNPSNWKVYDEITSKFKDQNEFKNVDGFDLDSLKEYREHHRINGASSVNMK